MQSAHHNDLNAPVPSADLIGRLPKTDLHVHLDGSLRLDTLIELARDARLELPSQTPEGLLELVFKERYDDLEDYLRAFSYTSPALCSEEALERAAYELGADNLAEGVCYVEVDDQDVEAILHQDRRYSSHRRRTSHRELVPAATFS